MIEINMNRKKFRQEYLKSIENSIRTGEDVCEDPYFDKVYDILNSCYGLELFTFLYSRSLTEKVNLFHRLKYNIDDDGCLSFVHVTMVGSSLVNKREKITITKDFVMEGEPISSNVFKMATTYGFKDFKLKSYTSTRFGWDTIDFLYNMLGDWKKIEKLGKYDAGSPKTYEYFNERNKMSKRFEEYIKGRNANVVR